MKRASSPTSRSLRASAKARRADGGDRSQALLNLWTRLTVRRECLDVQDGTTFIAMEYVPGRTLAETIPRNGLNVNQALRYAVQIADALARAHSGGVIHRDLKPGNIMVRPTIA